ncbi:hypothetical protein [Streptomyces corynorhini]|uniref:Uncharacterized protein n=1 Tax=Streptomyces corynorhini TaxID=2282652 RepID=A0A370BC97_9ACTN|nr:hypothetical protein [Streptomyces corynorhini]RDG37065.1 hypothetical protein DVH02_16680 [Streptomyces corynorhini]
MVTEVLPLGVAGLAVLLAGAVGPALVDELPVVADDLLGIDRDVCLSGVEIEVVKEFRGDVDRQAAVDGLRVLEAADRVQDVVGERQRCHCPATGQTSPGVVGEVLQIQGQQVLAGDDAHAGDHVQGLGRVLVAALSAGVLLEFGEQDRLVVATVGVVDVQRRLPNSQP